MLTRRNFMGASLAAAAYTASSWAPVWAQNAPDLGTPTLPHPGFKKMRVGDAQVIAIHDGIARRPLAEEFVKNAPLADVRALLAEQGLSTEYIDIPFTPFVIIHGGQKTLIDTGLGEFGGATTGKLLANLQAAGLQASDINNILISHYHGDHINGLRKASGELTFPNARINVPAVEHAFWMDDTKMQAATGGLKGAFDNARRVFSGMPADALVTFEAKQTLVPGVRAIAAYGHTPGHTLFELSSAGKSFHYMSDLTNVPALFARNPDFAVTFDMDAEAARLVRRSILAKVASQSSLVGGFHFPAPSMGRMVARGKGYAFQPIA